MRKLGSYQLGYRLVNLYLDPKQSGGLCNLCENGQHAKIIVGVENGRDQAWDVLIHEVFELAMSDHDAVYTQNGINRGLTQYFTFMFTHEQFVKIASSAAWFIEECFMDFRKAFNSKGDYK